MTEKLRIRKNVQPPTVGFIGTLLTSSKLNPASPTKGHTITRSVSALSNISVYCGLKQGIYCLNLFKGFETTALLIHDHGVL